MQDDRLVKELLIKGGVEPISPEFTPAVMQRVHAIYANNANRASLVGTRGKLIFKIAFVSVLCLVIVFSFIIHPAHLPSVIDGIDQKTGYQIVLYVLSFWVFVFINQRPGKRDFLKGL